MTALLVKTLLKERFSLGRLFGQKIAKSKTQSFLMIGIMIYAFGVTSLSNGMLNYERALALIEINQLQQLLLNLFTQLTSIGFLLGFFQAQGYLFQYKDFDLLGSLPIPQKSITTSKLFIMMIFVYVFAGIIVLPIYIIWWVFVMPPIWHLLIFIPLFLLAPLPALLVGSLISFLIRKLTQRLVNANVLQTIFSVLFMISFVLLSTVSPMFWSTWLPLPILNFFEQSNLFQVWFVDALNQESLLSFGLFVIAHIVLLEIFVYAMSGPLLRVNQNRSQAAVRSNYKVPKQIRPILFHFIYKEWQRFIGTSVYFLNAGIGIIMILAIPFFALFVPGLISELSTTLLNSNMHPFWVWFFVGGFALSTVYTPAVSLSLEGKNFGLLKTLPIEPMMVFKGKIVFNLLLTIPAIVFATIVLGVLFSLPFLIILLGIVSLILLATFLSILFLFFNLWFPRFDYHHEVEVVKQSLAALLAIFGGFALLIMFGWIVFGLLNTWTIIEQLLLIISLETIMTIVIWLYLKSISQKRWQELTI
jgi:ABC-2 type transport system permease protein